MRRTTLLLLLALCAAPAAAQDAIDLHAAQVFSSPSDVANWPATAAITGLHLRDSSNPNAGVAIDFTRAQDWPDYTPPGWTGALQYTVWAVVNVNGQWFTSGFIQMWRSRPSTGAPILTDFAKNWAYDARWGPMMGHQPAVGEQMGFFVTAGNARGVGGVTSVRERSNVVLVSLPAGDYGDFAFSGQPTAPPAPVLPPPPSVVPPPVVPVPVVPPPAPVTIDLSGVLARLDQLVDIEKDTNTQVTSMNRTVGQTLGAVMTFVGKYIAPAVAAWYAAKKLG